MLFILGRGGSEPLPVTSQHLLCERYPAPPPGRSYPQLKLQCRSLLIKEWEEAAPDPARYPYRPSLWPHPFMGLNKFTAGRLHQMRSGKSYLRAHPSRSDDAPTTCPNCDEAPETSEHAILRCSAKGPARARHLQGVSDIGPDAPVWSSAPLLGALSRFISSTATAFPPGMFSRTTSSAGSISSLSSNLVSFAYFKSSQEIQVYFVCFRLSAGLRRVSFTVLLLMSCPCVGLGPVRTPVEDLDDGFFLCEFVLAFGFCFRHS